MSTEKKPRLLDLFCGAGGASMGYHRAGFDVYGVDNRPQPHYPFPFLLMDALDAMDKLLRGEGLTFSNGETLYLKDFDAYHASPPCQRFSAITQQHGKEVVESHPDLIGGVRTLLVNTGRHYVIENVPKAPLLNPVMLCGSMFGLLSGEFHLRRHRHFECSFDWWPPASCCHQGLSLSVYGHPGGNSCRDHRKFGSSKDWRIGMGIDWMGNDELAQAIPPCYTCFIGGYLLSAVLGGKHQPYDSVPGRKCDTCDVHHLNNQPQRKSDLVDNAFSSHLSLPMCGVNGGNSHQLEQHLNETDLHNED